MIYREKKIYSGNMLEVEIYPITIQERKQSRKKKEKESLRKQKNLNDKNAKKHLIRLTNNNFTDKDLSTTLTYDDKNLPTCEENARRDVINYIRRLKHYRKKHGLPDLKYIAVIEYRKQEENKKPVRIHHHIVMSGMDRDIVEQLWSKGRANSDRMQANEFGYEGLARYISKDPKGNKRWIQSKNLKQPVIKVNDFKYSRRKVEELTVCQGEKEIFGRIYPGYFLSNYEVQQNQITAGNYIYIKMRKLRI